jgi:tetratricopeptide (TPR) repeat protein
MAKRRAPRAGGRHPGHGAAGDRAARLLRDGMARQQAGDLDGAARCFREVLAERPEPAQALRAQALGLLGTVELQARRPEAAAEAFAGVTRLLPDHADGHHCLGLALGMLQRFPEAEASFRQALACRPDHVHAHTQLGILLKERGALDEAEDHLERAVALAPRAPGPRYHLALVAERQGRAGEAEARLTALVRVAPNFGPAHARLGRLSLAQGAVPLAVSHLARWAAAEPDNPAAHVELGLARMPQGDLDGALAAFDRALALDPDNERAAASKAAALDRKGEFAAAYGAIQGPIEGGTAGPEAAAAFAAMAHRVGREAEALALAERLLAAGDLAPEARSLLHFRAGALCDRKGDYGAAFAHYRAGNDLGRGEFDRAAHAARIDALIEAFGADRMGRLPRASHRFRFPVFIVGMPRSGTTLVEQIIASHPAAFGAGERGEIAGLAEGLPARLGAAASYPACVADLDRDTLDRMAASYHDALRAGAPPEVERITDKMPHNFLHLGLIALLFPAGRIIHTVRDARDCCLSCYFQPFVGHHPYAQDLGDLGAYYREYRRLMAHWTGVLDIPVLEVRYEDLVAEPEAHSRRMIDFLGLPWDDACLRFHESGRAVATSSYDQVRRPVYKASAGRWRHYEAHLGPLLEALGEAP